MGEVINGYDLIEPLQNRDAGFSRWTYAVKDGKLYFLKEFMDPVYPAADSLSEKLRKQRIQDCEEYEEEKRNIYETVNRASDGNLVRVFEFFRYDSHYYISTLKIDPLEISFEEIAALPLDMRLLLCGTVAHSIMELHRAGIVHADLKASNVLLQRTETGQIAGKIIDFDCSFSENKPPEEEGALGGDQVYLAPEACQFLCGDDVSLTSKMDVFALGLLFHQYLTGSLPEFDHSEYDYAHEAVLDGQELFVSEELSKEIRGLIRQMLLGDPEKRCSSEKVFRELSRLGSRGSADEEDSSEGGCDEEEQEENSAFSGYFHLPGDL